MKILSYNLFGVKDTEKPIPNWDIRQKNLRRILNNLLKDNDIKICCFQEVNKNNIFLINKILNDNNFQLLDKFPMKIKSLIQYNIVAIKNDNKLKLNFVYCLPHGKDKVYKNIDEQIIDYNMSDYRTTVFCYFEYENKNYLVGNIHADHISMFGKIHGILKSLEYMDSF